MLAVPIPSKYSGNISNGMSGVTSVETVNAIHFPEGLEYRFQVGEGTYILRDDLQLATPPPHPSDIPPLNPNPLTTAVVPPTSGVKLSLVSLNSKTTRPELTRSATVGSSLLRWRTLGIKDNKEVKEVKEPKEVEKLKDTEKDVRFSTDSDSETSGPPGSANGSNRSSALPVFGDGNAALTPVPNKDPLKRRKPKNNIVKSNSSFVSRVITHENLSKRLAERDQGGTFAFININRSVQWLDLSSSIKAEPMTKILFTKAHMLCHDINAATKHASHLDIIMGSSASDMIWYEPVSQKYARINKHGIINPSPVTKIKWIPGSENLFLAAHTDGALVVYDKEKEDAPFSPEDPVDGAIMVEDDDHSSLNITKSVNSSNQKANPVACWRLSNQKITDFAFSPDSKYLAVVAEDGYLRIIDHLKEKITDVYSSYYGGFTCVCWSPDGKYILSGGQDDLVTIWSLTERQIVARCQGHDSWVTAVAFDPWRCDTKTYRFGSVGADRRLLLWDFSVGMLHRPKGAMTRTRGSISAQSLSLARNRTESSSIVNRMRSDSNRTQTAASLQLAEEPEHEFLNHEVEPRSRTAQLPPVLSKVIDEHPLSALAFEQDCIITACSEGHLRTWNRPEKGLKNMRPAM